VFYEVEESESKHLKDISPFHLIDIRNQFKTNFLTEPLLCLFDVETIQEGELVTLINRKFSSFVKKWTRKITDA
jgi:hypothetical protein